MYRDIDIQSVMFILERSFDSDNPSIYMAGTIGGVGLILLILVLVIAVMAKKNNISKNSDPNEGNVYPC